MYTFYTKNKCAYPGYNGRQGYYGEHSVVRDIYTCSRLPRQYLRTLWLGGYAQTSCAKRSSCLVVTI